VNDLRQTQPHAPGFCFGRRFSGALILAGLLLATSPVQAAEPADTADARHVVAFSIPAQGLASALEIFSRVSNVQVLYDSRLAAGQHSTAVQGELPVDVALQTLLQGTGLLVHYTRGHDVILMPVGGEPALSTMGVPPVAMLSLQTLHVEPPQVSAAPVDHVAYRLYGGLMEARIREALEENRAVSHGNFGISLSIWISPTGLLQRYVLLHSTGGPDRDSVIARALRGLSFGQAPPADLPQPVTMGIQVRSP
jgi:hypothetical protein